MEWLRRGALVALSLAAVSFGAKAQDYPTRTLTFVVPFTPGAAVDAASAKTTNAAQRNLCISRSLPFPTTAIRRCRHRG